MISRQYPVFIISLAQLFGTSLWFSINSVSDQLMAIWGFSLSDLGIMTNAVQFGFIIGTLFISLTGLADRFQASRIFFISAIVGALFNTCLVWLASDFIVVFFLRFGVGVCLAGIYPLGMKLIVGWAPERAGSALSQLVGMLTLGTALPHGMRALGADLSWQFIIGTSSILSVIGGSMVYALGDGPYTNVKNHVSSFKDIEFGAIINVFKIPRFRYSALGYFGHMWELYAFWTIIPVYIASLSLPNIIFLGSASGLSFFVIGIGFFGCIIGGWISRYVGSPMVAVVSLIISGFCCFFIVFVIEFLEFWKILSIFLLWGLTVISDSPHFSALSAQACPKELVGSALAIQNAVGFSITIVSIGLIAGSFESMGIRSAWLLLPGPIFGLIGFWPILHRSR